MYNIFMEILNKDIKHKLYQTWKNIVNRCTNPKDKRFSYYSKKGICVEWLKYENFKKDMRYDLIVHILEYGFKESTIDRIDNNKGYYKKNCRWATWKQQFENSSHKPVSFKSSKCKTCGKEILSKAKKERSFCSHKCVAKHKSDFLFKTTGKTSEERKRERANKLYKTCPLYRNKRSKMMKKYYLKNKKQIQKIQKIWRENNREKVNSYVRNYYNKIHNKNIA